MIDLHDPHVFSAGEIRIARDRALAALGRLDGTVAGLGGDALAIFAKRLVTGCVIDALRVERHAFTEGRFAAWCAGIGTLSDEATNRQRSPSQVMRAVLGELATHSWAPLAEAAQAFHDVAKPLADGPRSPDEADPVDDLWEAHELAASIAPSEEPNLALAYAEAAREHVVFAPRETQLRMFGDGAYRKTYQLTSAGPPTWALGLYVGTVLKADGLLRQALPLPGAIVAHALRQDIEGGERYLAHYTAIGRAAEALAKAADEARGADTVVRERCASLRSSSRAPSLARHLAGLGALRSDQIERVLGLSRAGVHGMIASLRRLGLVSSTKVSGVKLHAFVVNTPTGEHVRSGRPTPLASLSTAALDEFDGAMKAVDAILTKSQTD
ncbi:hypothetical protein [Qipengyuania citrea]|uniref:hypothetical protein n=1 Tax=Qipengyuania citrea TaxID=225971 RepID=UPI0032999E6E